MQKKAKILCQFYQYLSLVLSIFFIILFFINSEKRYNFLVFSILLIWINNIFYAIQHFKKRCIFFFLNLTIFSFLVARPLISIIYSEDWIQHILTYYSPNADILTGLICVLVSLYFLWVGALFGDIYYISKQSEKRILAKRDESFRHDLQIVSAIIYIVSLLFTFIIGSEKVIFVQRHSYVEYYTIFKSQLPYIIYVFSTFTRYSFFFYLTTLPTKKAATVFSITYILSTVPDLILGARNPFILSVLTVFIYFILRDFWKSREQWIGKWEYIGMAILIPIGLVFLGTYMYLREGKGLHFSGFFDSITDLFYNLGISFSHLSSGLGVLSQLPQKPFTCYTFGSIIDYVIYGTVGQNIWGTPSLGNGNTLLRATLGNNMAHHVSYVLLGDWYLEGHGVGSCYLLEVFADYGYIGIILFSIVVGFFVTYMTEYSKKGVIQFGFLLLSIEGILFMPRSSAIGFISFAFTLQFWVSFIACFGGAALLARRFKGEKKG